MENLKPNKPEEDDDNITLPLSDYLNDLLGTLENGVPRKAVSMMKALLIDAKDKERRVHVQFESFDGNKLEYPVVWRLREWKSSYGKYQADKKRQARERLEANLTTENTDKLVKAMMQSSGLNDPAIFRSLARKVAARKEQIAADLFKVKIELPPEEKE